MELNQYLGMFIDEAREHLQAMNDNMLQLEQSPDDISIVQVMFRSAHTLKGMSATMGFEELATLTHEMENVLDLVRNHKLRMTEPIFDVLFQCLDALETMVQDIIAGGTGKADVTAIVASLQAIAKGDVPASAAIPSAQSAAASAGSAGSAAGMLDQFQLSVAEQSLQAGLGLYRIDISLAPTCVLKAARAFMVFQVFEKFGEVVKSQPAVQDIEQEKFDKGFTVYFVTEHPKEELEKALGSISEVEPPVVTAITAADLKQMREGEIAKQETAAAAAAAAPRPAERRERAAAPAAGPSAGAPAGASGGAVNRTIRVDIEKLDTLMNLFSELLIDRVRLESLASELRSQALTETVEHMARVSSDLQNIVLKLRMVPVESVFNRFPRLIRDLAKTLDKKIELVITGADTELDRTVIDEIGDPLVHLLRNSGDHGIERPDERVAAGKPEQGTVHLRAYHSGNHVFIEIEDDGRGIHTEKVMQTAIKRGVITADQAKSMKDEEIHMLLFAPGFSTADKITDISGRGVGLDVVKTKIESLGGKVTVESRWGQGTKFTVQLPLTLSIIAAMLIRVGDEKYAIPLSSMVETSLIPRSEIRVVHGERLIQYRGSVIPILFLSEVLDVPGADTSAEELFVVIVRKGERLMALVVDDLIGQQEIVLKSLGSYLSKVFAVSGATILGDGHVALILDPNALLK
ncbi:chemotaxis protein CheW [Paenibacillus thermoaerophilus]|uniref:Chemotaxis protein CheA n=1 Tax=Paenibacillus thermoaerophilus TaxID=1215385 RepID=A0ABW2V599_9BACL|nr:chemotaxis protein CheA [Paenibacillus thermoaerophilus]TMV13814.1 chemotaxis protein CheA [Paenibacillus thermoaerophilus]